MPIRDIVVTAVVFGALPVILFKPWIGILAWTWLGLMNPHRLSWGFAHDFPFAQLVAIATFAGMALNFKHLTFRWEAPAKVLALFIGWMAITTVFAMYREPAIDQGIKNAKIMVMVFATMILIDDQRKLNALIWIIVLSLSYFGVKGGIYTVMGGGSGQVLGPEGSFFSGNTEAGLVMTMLLPLQRYLQLQSKTQWMRYGLLLSLVLTSVAAIGTQSRGAMVAMLAIGVFLWVKSRNKAGLFIVIVLVACGIVALMPDAWFQRMATIQDYESDGSALGRIGAWRLAIAIAANNFFGGGFASFTQENYAIYMQEFLISETGNVADAHSIYFQVLGHHGFVGLAIFLVLLTVTWRSLSRVIAATRNDPALLWMSDLSSMLQVSLIGFIVGGAFLGLAYFDLTYAIIAIACILTTLQKRAAKARRPSSSDALAEQRVIGETVRT
jgi:probable O-glycosylation ligase (exosortase A-associated)